MPSPYLINHETVFQEIKHSRIQIRKQIINSQKKKEACQKNNENKFRRKKKNKKQHERQTTKALRHLERRIFLTDYTKTPEATSSK